MANTFREKGFLIPIMCSYLSQSAAYFMHSGFLLHIISNYAFITLCGSPHNVCNDEGKLLGLPWNRALTDDHGVPYDIVCGTFFVAGLKEDDFASLTEQQIEKYKDKYSNEMILSVPKQPEAHKKPMKKEKHEYER